MKENDKTPNLFDFATSELSHDAFIAWLLSWADPSFKDQQLHTFSQAVLFDFIEITGKNIPDVQKVDVKTQYRNIDVLVLLTDESGQRWVVIVENKMHTREHSDQLNRYREDIHKDEKLEDITDSHILGIYYKMWEQSDMGRVKKSEFFHFGRGHMLKLLEENYKSGTSDIVDQYFQYLSGIQLELDAFQKKAVKDWNSTQWTGLYTKLKEELNDGDFGYIPNRSGGFMGYWFGGCDIDADANIYVQSEQDKLCFKIYVGKKEDRQSAKWFWHDAVIKAGKSIGLEIVKPKVMRTGQWFTIGVLNTDDDKPWMKTDDENIVQLPETIEIARKATQVVKKASEKQSEWECYKIEHKI